MPCTKDFKVDTSKPVMVTGATGYVAGMLISLLLKKGVTVHATVRDPSKKDELQYLHDLAIATTGPLTLYRADLLAEGSFDEAAKGCAIIFHTASPFNLSSGNPVKEVIEPAVRGTENVLNTANNTPTVKRVVLTSSTLAIYGHASDAKSVPNGVFTEESWNRSSTVDDGPYSLSKTIAEQKAWVMAGSQTQWDMVVMNPSLVMGPGVKYHDSSESYKLIIALFGGSMPYGTVDLPLGCVDVRDVAAAHIAAAYLPNLKGRHILNGHNTSFPKMGKALAEKYKPAQYGLSGSILPIPNLMLWLLAPYINLTRKTVANDFGYTINLDNTKAMTQLGLDFLPLETTLQDMYQQLLDLKVIKPKE